MKYIPILLLLFVALGCVRMDEAPKSPKPVFSPTPLPVDKLRMNLTPAEKLERRRQFVKTLEHEMLDRGRDYRVSLRGKDSDTLHIQWVLMSRPEFHQLTKDNEFLDLLHAIGFKMITATDGSYATFSMPVPEWPE